MKGLAFDITLDDSESYAIVIDTRFINLHINLPLESELKELNLMWHLKI